jgi:hypothetical protein
MGTFAGRAIKDNTHMWQMGRAPDHRIDAPLIPPYPSEIRKAGRGRRREATHPEKEPPVDNK